MYIFKLQNFIKPQMKYFIGAQTSVALETAIDLQLPLIVAMLMDDGVLQGDLSVIGKYAALYIMLLAINAVLIFCFGYCSAHASNNMAASIRLKTFLHINSLKLSQTYSVTAGSLITRLTSDINVLQESTNLMQRLAIRGPLQLVGGIFMLLFLDNRFALLLAVAMVILVLIVGFVVKYTQPMYKLIQAGMDKLNTINQESIVGLRTIKAYHGEKNEKERFDDSNRDVSKTVFRVQRLVSMMQPAFGIVMNVTLAILLVIGSRAVESNDLQIGQVMATISYLTQILFALMMLVMIFPSLSRASISLQRIKEVYALEVEEESSLDKKESLKEIESIEFSNVSFTYPVIESNKEQRASLTNINFKIKVGEKVAFLGTTGAGKSTLIKILFGLYEPNEGNVLINGKNLQNYKIQDVRNAISYVLQRSDLFNTSIHENITFGDTNYTRDEVRFAAKIAQAEDFIMDFEEDFERELGSKGVGVSGGQKQRINLSRAFLKKSDVLVLDDCTSALDLRTEKRVYEAIRETDMYTSIILISQKVVSVKDMDRIYILDKGRIVDSGTHNELIKNSSHYRDFCFSQSVNIDANIGGDNE